MRCAVHIHFLVREEVFQDLCETILDKAGEILVKLSLDVTL